ncbi:unnamed protein product, partial [Brenthis ino]
MNYNKLKIPPGLLVTASLSGGLSIILSLTNIVLCILVLLYRFNCAAGDLGSNSANGAHFFLLTILKTYILEEDCENALSEENLTTSRLIFILTIVILVLAVITFFTAITMLSVINSDSPVKYTDVIMYFYVGVCVAALVVDLTLGVHFGIDHESLKDILAVNAPGLQSNYHRDTIRLGALLLMTICLKGYIGHVINIVLLIWLVAQVMDYQKMLNDDEHSIHKLGVLNAFDAPKRFEDPWNSHHNDMYLRQPRAPHLHNSTHDEPRPRETPYGNTNSTKRLEDPWNPQRNDVFIASGPQINPAFIDDERSRPSTRENVVPERNRPSNRSDSWLHNQINSGQGLGSRPFSYLEEPRRPEPLRQLSPTNDPQWRRNPWQSGPPVPDPDYSPPPRRLKSALKSNYP